MGIKSRSSGAFSGTTYYIAAAGNDSHDGKSPATAWATIAKVNSATLHPGDAVLFNGGDTFNDATLFINGTNVPSLGDIKNPILVQSYGNGRATLAAATNSLATYNSKGVMAVIDSVNGVVFQNMTINGYGVGTVLDNPTDFANVSNWTLNNSTILNNQATAPDSTNTAASITDNGVNGAHAEFLTTGVANLVVGVTYTLNISLKQGTARFVSVRGGPTDQAATINPWVTVDTQLGTVAANGAVSASSIVSQGSGWWRLTMSWVNVSNATIGVFPVIALSNSSAAPATTSNLGMTYVGTGTTAYMWGLNMTALRAATFGILIQNSLGANRAASMQNITVKNCTIIDCAPVIDPNTISTGAIYCAGFSIGNSNCGGISNINILNNTMYCVTNIGYGIGLSGDSCNGDPVNTNNTTGLLCQGNLVYNMGIGFLVAGWGGPYVDPTKNPIANLAQYNIAHDCGLGTNHCGSDVAFECYQAVNVAFQFNEAYNQGDSTGLLNNACDQGSFDIDIACEHILVQYNYSHYNQGYFIAVNGGGGAYGHATIRYNISENDNNITGNGAILGVISVDNPPANPVWIYNNTIYQNVSNSGSQPPPGINWGFSSGAAWAAGSVVANNLFYTLGQNAFGERSFVTASVVPVGSLYCDYNMYYNGNNSSAKMFTTSSNISSLAAWQSATGLDAHSIVAASNPGIAAPGSGGTLSWPPQAQTTWPPGGTAYKLTGGSPCIGTGVDLTQSPFFLNVGTRDFFGNSIPHGVGTGYNIGAYGGT